ncbi:PAAR domain-containing protein [Pseudomonas sp. RGM2987]|uniref:PAAR domain-containing protein n=1 Tax=Pseudomonas sp. RGM2987 TaxID=2930090 RepID=UPI001FD674F1|nr:PAAR domain-containing protein [Pseudomonas sp. RGM2987]MCJ8207136.1 PAAR domain-containing protein [Pseudomonas sp. RGM2987]
MKAIVRMGDTLREYGGKVLEGHYESEGLPIACQGDAVHCALHGRTRIAEGSELMHIDGRPVALDGHRCACNCTLVSSMPDTQVAS